MSCVGRTRLPSPVLRSHALLACSSQRASQADRSIVSQREGLGLLSLRAFSQHCLSQPLISVCCQHSLQGMLITRRPQCASRVPSTCRSSTNNGNTSACCVVRGCVRARRSVRVGKTAPPAAQRLPTMQACRPGATGQHGEDGTCDCSYAILHRSCPQRILRRPDAGRGSMPSIAGPLSGNGWRPARCDGRGARAVRGLASRLG